MKKFVVLFAILAGCNSDTKVSYMDGNWSSKCVPYVFVNDKVESWALYTWSFHNGRFQFNRAAYNDSQCHVIEEDSCFSHLYPKIGYFDYLNDIDTASGMVAKTYKFVETQFGPENYRLSEDYEKCARDEDEELGEYEPSFFINNDSLYRVYKEEGVGNVIFYEHPFYKI